MKVLIAQKTMLRWIKLESKLTSVFYPSGYKCLICGCEIDGGNFEFCKKCFKTLPQIVGKTCVKCGEPIFSDSELCLFCKKEMPSFTKCFAPYTFSPPITDLIYRLKYNGEKFVAKTLSNLLLKFFMEQNVDVDIVIPVPLHLKREAQRKFNQSELLAQSFKEHGFNVDVTCVVRTKNTTTQTALSKQLRKQNMEEAFKVLVKSKVKNKNVLLIDDVYTTGATFNSLSNTLKKCGAKNVYGLSLAHTKMEDIVKS